MSIYLNQFVQATVDTKHCDEVIIIKNTNLEYCYASPSMVQSHGFQSLSAMEGRTIHEVSSPIITIADDLRKEEAECINEQVKVKSILFSGGEVELYSEKSPIRDPLTKQVVGIIMRIQKVQVPFCYRRVLGTLIKDFNHSKLLSNSSKLLSNNSPLENIKLTKRERIVLFLCILNYNFEQISAIVSKIEKKLVCVNLIRNNVNQQLYRKFEVNSISNLVDKAISINYHNYIPLGFLFNFPIKDR